MIINNNKKIVLESAVVPSKISSKLAMMVGAGLIISSYASVQAADKVAEAALADQLLKKIDERDKVIDDLLRRVQQLEHTNAVYSQPNRQANTAVAVEKTNPPEKIAAVPSTPPINQLPVQKNTAATQKSKAAPGSFEVDEDASQRALERTLVQTGALLLPVGQAEIQPFANYSRRENQRPLLFADNNILQVANESFRQNEFDTGANFLVGLPFESQAEFRIPYQVVNQSVVLQNGTNSREISNTGNSLGDINVGLAKTLAHETNWTPDLIARFTWNAPTGNTSDNDVLMGSGLNSFIASMTALKRQDPLAFTGRVAYQKTLKKNDIELGDQINLTLGATLAASPQTSLSLGIQQTYAFETKFNNINVEGSDFVSSAFTVGAASTIGRRLFFSALGGVGLTNSAPAYFFNITVPFRFDVPFKSAEYRP